MIPLFATNPESMIKVRVVTVQDQPERTFKTLHKANTLHIDISAKLEALVNTSFKQELHTTYDFLTPIDDIITYIQAGEHTYLEGKIKPNYSTSLKESGIEGSSVAVKWN